MPSTEKVGNVSVGRYEQIVERLREAAEKLSRSSFIIGDGALEVVPMQEHSGRSVGDDLFGVSAWLHRLTTPAHQAISPSRRRMKEAQ
ncbi:hypothetical protein [Streptomyces echinatus]|uniref:hypothetical protein n=1 Tax=Streptomyces echinatus TaxID=67293 RepID=UPI0037A596A3